jgi:hypothetical protein
LGIENLDYLILIVKKWPNNVCVECVEGKLQSMQDFLSSKAVLIEEHKKSRKRDCLKKDYDDIWEMPVANMGVGCGFVDSVGSTLL